MNRPMSVLLVLAALLSSASVMAQGTLDRIRERGELRIGYRTDARPLSFEENGAPSGYSVDLCKRIAAALYAGPGIVPNSRRNRGIRRILNAEC